MVVSSFKFLLKEKDLKKDFKPDYCWRVRQQYTIYHERNDKIKFPFFTGYWRGC
jgi:hypothetical protein